MSPPDVPLSPHLCVFTNLEHLCILSFRVCMRAFPLSGHRSGSSRKPARPRGCVFRCWHWTTQSGLIRAHCACVILPLYFPVPLPGTPFLPSGGWLGFTCLLKCLTVGFPWEALSESHHHVPPPRSPPFVWFSIAQQSNNCWFPCLPSPRGWRPLTTKERSTTSKALSIHLPFRSATPLHGRAWSPWLTD